MKIPLLIAPDLVNYCALQQLRFSIPLCFNNLYQWNYRIITMWIKSFFLISQWLHLNFFVLNPIYHRGRFQNAIAQIVSELKSLEKIDELINNTSALSNLTPNAIASATTDRFFRKEAETEQQLFNSQLLIKKFRYLGLNNSIHDHVSCWQYFCE